MIYRLQTAREEKGDGSVPLLHIVTHPDLGEACVRCLKNKNVKNGDVDLNKGGHGRGGDCIDSSPLRR